MRSRKLLLFVLSTALMVAGQETWTTITPKPVTESFLGITYAKGMFVAVGAKGTIITSADGLTWKLQSSGTSRALYGVTFGNDRFMAVGDSGTVLTSLDGNAWLDRSSIDSILGRIGIGAVTYGVGRFVICAMWPICSDDNGISWAPSPSLRVDGFSAAHYGNGLFIVVGPRSYIMNSPDGNTWVTISAWPSPLPLITSSTYRGFASSDKCFVIVGSESPAILPRGKIITSTDGFTWIDANHTANDLYAVAYGNNNFMTVGVMGEIHSSPDGFTWTRMESGTKELLTGIAYGNNTFVAVGDTGTILTSPAIVPVILPGRPEPHSINGMIISPKIGSFFVKAAGKVTISFVNMNGKIVATVIDGFYPPGKYSFPLPSSLCPGGYILSFRSGSGVLSRKVTLIK